jgi:hypothetical protein
MGTIDLKFIVIDTSAYPPHCVLSLLNKGQDINRWRAYRK